MHAFDTDRFTATAQVVSQKQRGEPTSESQLRETFGNADAELCSSAGDNVSQRTALWS